MKKLGKTVKLRDRSIARIAFLAKTDSASGFRDYLNALVEEDAKIHFDRRVSVKEEGKWKKDTLAAMEKNDGYVLVAKVDGHIAGVSGANRERLRGRGNIYLGLSVGKKFRRHGLGSALLSANIETAKRFFRPKPEIIYLSVFGNNKPAISLYQKLGFKVFAIFPDWMPYKRKRVDIIFMRLGK
jgi:ribosomal protein S18 acetylase RimI-like enzyme